MGLRVVDINPSVIADQTQDPALLSGSSIADLASSGRVGTIGPGDVLSVDIFETGTPLFSGGQLSIGGEVSSAIDTSARRASLPGVTVDEDGDISLPYVGRIKVAGMTPDEVQAMVERRLIGKSQSPQVMVSVHENVANTVFVMGQAHHPGRMPLSGARERLLDAIATAGGSTDAPEDTIVRLSRHGRAAQAELSAIRTGTPADVVLLPNDRIELINRPRSYIVLGATGRVSQVPFGAERLSLAEAIARTGGPNDQQADPSAVFVFRYEGNQKPSPGETPTIYRLNMLRPSQLFLAQRFSMHDKDLIYIANAQSNLPTKLVQIIDQLFTPIFLAQQAGL